MTLSRLATATADLMDALDALAARPHAPPLLEMRWMRQPDPQGHVPPGTVLLLTGQGPTAAHKGNWPTESAHQRLADAPLLSAAHRAMEDWHAAWAHHPFLRTLLHPYGQAHRWEHLGLTRHSPERRHAPARWACSVAGWQSSEIFQDRPTLLDVLDATARAPGHRAHHAAFTPEGRQVLQADLPRTALDALAPLVGTGPLPGPALPTAWEGVWRHAGTARLASSALRVPPAAHRRQVDAILEPVLEAARALQEPPTPGVPPVRSVGANSVGHHTTPDVYLWTGKGAGKRQEAVRWALARQPHRMPKAERFAQAWKKACVQMQAACPVLAPPTAGQSWQIKIAMDPLAAQPVSIFASGMRSTPDLFAYACGRPPGPPTLLTPQGSGSYAAMFLASLAEAADLYAHASPETARQGLDLWRRPLDHAR